MGAPISGRWPVGAHPFGERGAVRTLAGWVSGPYDLAASAESPFESTGRPVSGAVQNRTPVSNDWHPVQLLVQNRTAAIKLDGLGSHYELQLLLTSGHAANSLHS